LEPRAASVRDFSDLMMTIPILGPFFLTMTQLSMPWILRFLYTPEF